MKSGVVCIQSTARYIILYIISVPARLGKGQGTKEIGHNLASEKTKFGHNLVRKRHKIGHAFTCERPKFGHKSARERSEVSVFQLGLEKGRVQKKLGII